MSDRDLVFFDMCLVSVLSFQFHPGNHLDQDDPDVRRKAIAQAVSVAADALAARNSYRDFVASWGA